MTQKIPLEEANRRLYEKHGDKITMSNYIAMGKYAHFLCNICGYEWDTVASSVITMGSGCMPCMKKSANYSDLIKYSHENKTISGIYCIERTETGQKYVGQGLDVNHRMNQTHYNCKLIYGAVKKYGNGAFKRYIVEYCFIENLEEREIYWIKELRSHVSEGGYNISWGGRSGMTGRNHTPETIQKMISAQIGENNWNYGNHLSLETKEKISQAKKNSSGGCNGGNKIGWRPSFESREKSSISQSGEKNHWFGKSPSVETRETISKSLKGKKRPKKASIFRGVSKIKRGDWTPRITIDGKRKSLGIYKTELEAAIAYDKYVVEHNLPNLLNFPDNR